MTAVLLGAPLLPDHATATSLEARVADLGRISSRLIDIGSHDALTVLRYSLSAPKVIFTLRSSPCFGHTLLTDFDNLQRNILSAIVNNSLNDSQWLQASLPVKFGGSGIRLVSSLAPSAFLASAMGTRGLQNLILTNCNTDITDFHIDRALAE